MALPPDPVYILRITSAGRTSPDVSAQRTFGRPRQRHPHSPTPPTRLCCKHLSPSFQRCQPRKAHVLSPCCILAWGVCEAKFSTAAYARNRADMIDAPRRPPRAVMVLTLTPKTFQPGHQGCARTYRCNDGQSLLGIQLARNSLGKPSSRGDRHPRR